MPFVADFIEAGESQFIGKLMVVVHRDMKLALDYFYPPVLPDTGLPDFAAMVRGAPSVFRFPLLTLAIERMTSVYADSGEWLSQDLTVGAGLVVDDDAIDGVHEKAEKYARAFRAVVRKGIPECLPPTSALMEDLPEINDRFLGYGEKKGGGYVQPIQFEIKVRFGEK